MIITIAVQKGGTGKTTTAAALAQAAAYRGKKVLAVDLDPQGDFSFALGAKEKGRGSCGLIEGEDIKKVTCHTKQGIDTVPATMDLAALQSFTGSARRLAEWAEIMNYRYDYTFIDTPSKAGELQTNALMASDAVIIPLLAELYSVKALSQTLATIKAVQKVHPLRIGVIITQYGGRTILARQMIETIEAQAAAEGIPLLGTVRKAVKIQEAAALQQSLYEYAPKSTTAEDYLAILDRIQ